MKFSRRKALQTGVCIGVTSLTGCLNITTPFSSKLTVELLNYDDDPHTIDLQILRADGKQNSEATVHSGWHELPARDDEPSHRLLEDIVASDRYLIRARLLESENEVFDHYHYYPDCGGNSTDDKVGVKIEKNETKGLFIDFDQNSCS
ncbi:hypothetical protein ACH9L7_02375 [Haloferax sp. S1W]|uniref:hypothetical protein n=1 Tax=Haloferax sp. S1W TaxID=3377110 RepID=UPI0037C9BC69